MLTKPTIDLDKKSLFDPSIALRRLIYAVATGCLLILSYGLRYAHSSFDSFLGVISAGMMAGGAALLTGGLLGFLFGVPHTQGDTSASDGKTREDSTDKPGKPSPRGPSTTYRPNTSLEQISDWLTKILVGVGLVQIKEIPGKMAALSAYVAKGLGNGEQAEAFALTLLVFFSVCGFVFGFLWARLYLVRWFREADDVQALGEKISRIEGQQLADARALALVQQQLNPGPDDAPASTQEVVQAVRGASAPVKIQIFNQAEKVADNRDAPDYDVRIGGVISILRGLIASDTNELYHRNHYELSMALYHKKDGDLQEAVSAISKAIEIRDKLRKTGWKFHEFHRARCLIKQIPLAARTKPSDPALVERILADLRESRTQSDKWQRWYDNDMNVQEWVATNAIDLKTLGKT